MPTSTIFIAFPLNERPPSKSIRNPNDNPNNPIREPMACINRNPSIIPEKYESRSISKDLLN